MDEVGDGAGRAGPMDDFINSNETGHFPSSAQKVE